MTSKEEKIRKIVKNILLGNGYDINKMFIFVNILNVKSVGVQGDNRTYSKPVLLEILDEEEYSIPIPYDILEEISNKISNKIEDVNRIVWEITKNNWKGDS